MVEPFHRRQKNALRARCANWVDHLPWVLLGLRTAAREDDSSTPAQAVLGSPLIIPGIFLDSPELPSKIFLEQFSKTLSAAEHTATRHNTSAAAAAGRPCPRADGVCEVGRTCTAAPAAVRRPLHRHRRSLHHFTLRIGDKRTRCPPTDSSPAPPLQRRLRSPGSRAVPPPPSTSGIFPHQGPRQPAGYASPHSSQQNCEP
jgi:hypothetical protein